MSGRDPAVEGFRAEVLAHYHAQGRRLPWRETSDPYAIMVSELMLQQTQVSRVEPKYLEFLDAFPNVIALAAAPLAAVLERWSGLGYNRRAERLKRCAEIIAAQHAGVVPDSEAVLVTLPGIGRATAAAIVTYAFGRCVPFIETNVRTVFLHRFFADADDVPDSAIMGPVAATWDDADPRTWGWALMDYGAYLKRTVPNPSRRSRHHNTQSRFEGSDRQARGALLRELLRQGAMTAEDAAACVDRATDEVERLLAGLERDRLVECADGRWMVRG